MSMKLLGFQKRSIHAHLLSPSCYMFMAHKFLFGLLEGHGLGSSEGDGIRSVSQASLGETNGDTNFTSSIGSWVRCCFAIGLTGQEV